MIITGTIILILILFIVVSIINDWVFEFFLYVIYIFVYIFYSRRKDLMRPKFYFNGDFIIHAFLDTDWELEHEVDNISESHCYKTKDESKAIREISYKKVYNKKDGWLQLGNISFNYRVCIIVNPFSFYRVENFLKNKPPLEREKRITEKRDLIIDSIL